MLKQELEDGQASLADPHFRADVLNGLAARPRAIPARWFYDRRGSELFEQITELDEYYPTRTEAALLRMIADDVAERVGPGRAVVEFGSGSSTKTPILLQAVDPSAYVPIDISGEFLRYSARALSERFPGLPVLPVEGDFLKPIPLPAQVRHVRDRSAGVGLRLASRLRRHLPARERGQVGERAQGDHLDALDETRLAGVRSRDGDSP